MEDKASMPILVQRLRNRQLEMLKIRTAASKHPRPLYVRVLLKFGFWAPVREGDARKLSVPSNSIDLILTSPPYLNAIDYIRCSKFTLVWMGYDVGELGDIRTESVGSEAGSAEARDNEIVRDIISDLNLRPQLSTRHDAVLAHYIEDMHAAVQEAARVLVPGGKAVYVIGENTVRGTYIPNSLIITAVAESSGLEAVDRRSRTLPANRRYLPPPSIRTEAVAALDTRMRREVILTFSKAA